MHPEELTAQDVNAYYDLFIRPGNRALCVFRNFSD